MAATGKKLVTADGLTKVMQGVGGGGVQFVELFSGSAGTVTLPQSFDTYKVLFVYIQGINGVTASDVCVPPDNRAFLYDGYSNRKVEFSGKQVTAPYDFTIERIYAIA